MHAPSVCAALAILFSTFLAVPTRADDASEMRLSGDFRLRHESNFDLPGQRDRHRQRVRLRIAAVRSLGEELEVGARITTGSRTDPNSPHQTLGSAFDRLELNLDRAYVSYRPRWASGLALRGGKFGHPFVRNPIYGALVWDDDVQPEGAAESFVHESPGGGARLELHAGQYLLLEQSDGGEAAAFVGQAAGTWASSGGPEVELALAYYHFTDLTPDSAQQLVDRNRGNALAPGGGDFRSDFGVLNPLLVVHVPAGAVRLTFSAEAAINARAEGDEDLAAGLGGSLEAGRWRVYYQYQDVEQEAVLSLLAGDDRLLTVSQRSQIFGLGVRLRDGAALHLWNLVSEPLVPPDFRPGDGRWRLRADANFRF